MTPPGDISQPGATAPLHVVEKSDALAAAAAPPPPAAAPARRGPVTLPLSVPIEAHGETLTSLTIRPPKVEEIEACDLISGRLTTRALSDCLVRVAGIPRSSVLQLEPSDYAAACNAVADFLVKRAPTS